MGYTICYHAIHSSRLHLDSMPCLSIRTVGRRKIATYRRRFASDRAPASKSPTWQPQYTQHYPNASNRKPRKITHIQTPGGMPIETANVRTPLVAQALCLCSFAPAFPCAAYCATSANSNHHSEKRRNKLPAALLASRRSEYTGQLWTNANSITESRRHNFARALGTSVCGCGLYLEPAT